MVTLLKANPERFVATAVSASEAQVTGSVVDDLPEISKHFGLVARVQVVQALGIVSPENRLDDLGSCFRHRFSSSVFDIDFPALFLVLVHWHTTFSES